MISRLVSNHLWLGSVITVCFRRSLLISFRFAAVQVFFHKMHIIEFPLSSIHYKLFIKLLFLVFAWCNSYTTIKIPLQSLFYKNDIFFIIRFETSFILFQKAFNFVIFSFFSQKIIKKTGFFFKNQNFFTLLHRIVRNMH